MKTVRFIHRLSEECRSISGWYVFTREGTLRLGGAEFLYLVGHGLIDSACCGFGGCRFALVPGTAVALRYTSDHEGRPISLVLPVTDPERQEEIASLLKRREGVSQVVFGPPEPYAYEEMNGRTGRSFSGEGRDMRR